MKSTKLCSALLLLLAVTVGCEKESIETPEMQLTEKQEPISLTDFVTSGVDLETYISKVQKFESKSINLNKSHSTSATLDRGEEFFDTFCSNLGVEGFENGRMRPENAGIFVGPLDFFANVGKFLPGEILPGISISTIYTVATDKPVLGLYGQLVRGSESKVIYAQIADHDLLIDFTTDEVQSVSLDILSFPYANEAASTGTEPTPTPIPAASQRVTIEVTYTSGVIHKEEVTASFEGLYWGTTGTKTISQIVLSSTNNDAWVGVDNIAFGLCEDNDGDGCVDWIDSAVNDRILNSNMEATLHIGSCNSGVPNVMTAACGVSMSDSMDILETGKYRNKGSWQSAVAALADQWIAAGLITLAQKEALMNCASSFNYQS